MRQYMNQFVSLFILCFVMCFHGLCFAETNAAPSGILWQPWSDKSFEQAKLKKNRVFLYIKADWCHWCQLMGDITLHDNQVIKVINANYVPVKLDVDRDIDIVKQYRPTSFPTMIIMDSGKRIIKRFSGFMKPEVLVQRLAF